MRYRFFCIVLFITVWAVVFWLDQLTKSMILENFSNLKTKVVVTSFFNLVKAYNTGASFGFLDGFEYSNRLFLIFNSAVVIGLIVWFMYSINRLNGVTVGMIVGGAIGNLVDRITKPGVVDFIQLHWQEQYYYPAFNIADSAIVIGVVILIITSFRKEHSN